MFLALRELRFARARFVLTGGVITLIAVLMVLLSGLSSGLVNDGASGLKAMPAAQPGRGGTAGARNRRALRCYSYGDA